MMSKLSTGWRVVIAYSLLAGATQMLWLTYAAITTDTARRYGVSEDAVGWLSEIFPLLYVLLAIPAGILLDRWFVPVLTAGGLLVGAGGLVRLGGQTFAWAMAGQVLIALAQPVVMSAVSKVAGEYLEQEQCALGIAVGSAGGFAGMPVALLLGPVIGGSRLELLLAIEGIAGALAALALARALRHPPRRSSESPTVRTGMVSLLWAQPTMRTLCALAFLGFGVFVALATWLQTLLHPDRVSETTAGALLVAMIVTGVIGCAALPALISERDSERGFLLLVVIVGAIGEILFGAIPWIGARFAIVLVMGVFLLPALPVILTAAERLAGPELAGSAAAIVWLAGNLGGLVVAVIVQVLVHRPLAAFLAMSFIFLCGAPFALRLTPQKARETLQLGFSHSP
jgi:predicted MFS family arabinose efflux permease